MSGDAELRAAIKVLREVYDDTAPFLEDDLWQSGATAVRLVIKNRIAALAATPEDTVGTDTEGSPP